MPSIRGARASTSGSVSAAEFKARCTSHHEKPNEAAASGRPSGSNNGGHQGIAKPAGGPGSAGDLGGLLGECPPRTKLLIAEESPLGPNHLDRARDRDIAQTLGPA
jgi:hypothetical protein